MQKDTFYIEQCAFSSVLQVTSRTLKINNIRTDGMKMFIFHYLGDYKKKSLLSGSQLS